MMVSKEIEKCHEKWRHIPEANLPGAVVPDQYVVLSLANRGRSDIVSWEISFTAQISPGKYLEARNTVGEQVEWSIRSGGAEHYIRQGEEIEIVVALTGPFPVAELKWGITSRDIRSKEYVRFAGDKTCKLRNPLADPQSGSQPLAE